MNIKKVIKKYSPNWIIKPLRFFWRCTGSYIVAINQKVRLNKFHGQQKREVVFDNERITILIQPRNGWVDNYIFLNSIHEPNILKVIKYSISKGDIVVDIGANIGQHTLFMSKFTGEKGKVYCFEPLNKNYRSIKKSIDLNNFKNVTVEKKAVGEKNTMIKIFIPNSNNDRSSRKLFEVSSDKYEETEMVTLDDYFSNKKIHFIKIDTEGFEPEVISGADKIITQHKPTILLEYSPLFYEQRKIESSSLLEYLSSQNYILNDIDSGYGHIDDIEKYTKYLITKGGGISNIIAHYEKNVQ